MVRPFFFSHEPVMAVPVITILVTQSSFKDNNIQKLQNLAYASSVFYQAFFYAFSFVFTVTPLHT